MQRPRRPSATPGCPNLITEGKACLTHLRESAALRGYDRDWRALRAAYLRHHPTCARCGRAATMVDHRIPLRAGGARLDVSNLRALCWSCHRRLTALATPEAHEDYRSRS